MLGAFLQSLITLFSVVDPLAAAVFFAALTVETGEAERARMARRAAVTVGGVLVAFLVAGQALFAVFSITLNAFRIAGGIVVGIMALDLLQATTTGVRATERERSEGLRKEDVSITPVAVPMLAGPGAISTVMLLAAEETGVGHQLQLGGVILLVTVAVWFCLDQAGRLVALMGETGIAVVSRLLGLIVLAIAVQFIADGAAEAVRLLAPTLCGLCR